MEIRVKIGNAISEIARLEKKRFKTYEDNARLRFLINHLNDIEVTKNYTFPPIDSNLRSEEIVSR